MKVLALFVCVGWSQDVLPISTRACVQILEGNYGYDQIASCETQSSASVNRARLSINTVITPRLNTSLNVGLLNNRTIKACMATKLHVNGSLVKRIGSTSSYGTVDLSDIQESDIKNQYIPKKKSTRPPSQPSAPIPKQVTPVEPASPEGNEDTHSPSESTPPTESFTSSEITDEDAKQMAEEELTRREEKTVLSGKGFRLAKFTGLRVAPEIIKATEDLQYEYMTNVQRKCIPRAVMGSDVVASDRTGTGKTAAYVIPALQLIHNVRKEVETEEKTEETVEEVKKLLTPSVLILTPTRELAEQVEEHVGLLSKHMQGGRAKVNCVHSGIPDSVHKKTEGIEITVANPGRLRHLLERESPLISLSQVKMIVVDECDKMLAMGLLPDVISVWKLLPKYSRHTKKKQILMYSATLTDKVEDMIKKLAPEADIVDLNESKSVAEGVEHIAFHVTPRRKQALLLYLIRRTGNVSLRDKQAIIFCRTRQRADRLAESIEAAGFKSASVHKEHSPSEREKRMERFKQNEIQFIVSTEVLARGIDVPSLPYVINFDVPVTAEDYVHRVGRTGRAGKKGRAITFVSKATQILTVGNRTTELDEKALVEKIEDFMNNQIRVLKVPGPWADVPKSGEEEAEVDINSATAQKMAESRIRELVVNKIREKSTDKTEFLKKVRKLKVYNDTTLRDFPEGRYEDVVNKLDYERVGSAEVMGRGPKGKREQMKNLAGSSPTDEKIGVTNLLGGINIWALGSKCMDTNQKNQIKNFFRREIERFGIMRTPTPKCRHQGH
ncbi:hypothetical protein PROFUN_04564 [Planoprotostelium fungivorum]|uniref:Uncharacterized protein n=1 Tax=Planoprotostelium fungivorum TaxID=1890364 RepID=A0A2P6NBJ6_9EUKA|nr:hypothetical protein PROFUN_04564 [Planoprotostelium fungivorum]